MAPLVVLFLFFQQSAGPRAGDVEPLLKAIAAYEHGQPRDSLEQLTRIVDDSTTSPALRSTVEARLLGFVQSPVSLAAKDFALRQLSRIASDTSIPVLLKLSARPETAELARYALARISGPAAESARRKLAAAPEPRPDSLSRAAASRGDRATALRLYREVLASGPPPHRRIAALSGIARIDLSAAVPLLTAELDSKHPRVQAVAVRLLSQAPGQKITELLIDRFEKLPPSGRIALLAALADRADRAALPFFHATIRTATGDLRIAALDALGRIGNASSAAVLAEAAAAGAENERAAARAALYSLHDPGVDPAIVSALGSSAGRVRIEMIIATGERGIAAAAPLITTAVDDPDPEVHREALRALRNIAGPDQVPALVDLVLRAATASDRRETAQNLAAVLKRSEASHMEAVIAAYRGSTAAPPRVALLEVMGQSSADAALPVLREALKSPQPEIARAAVLALSDWASPAPLADLLALARDPGSPVLQVLGLRGYLKLLGLPSKRPLAETATLLGHAMGLARQATEKRAVLSMLATFPCQEALVVAQAATRDAEVAKEAAAAVDRLNGLLKFQ